MVVQAFHCKHINIKKGISKVCITKVIPTIFNKLFSVFIRKRIKINFFEHLVDYFYLSSVVIGSL